MYILPTHPTSNLNKTTAGLGLGLTSLVAAPALGAASHGAKGFFAGLGAGVAGAVVLPVAGLVGGLTCAIGGLEWVGGWALVVLLYLDLTHTRTPHYQHDYHS